MKRKTGRKWSTENCARCGDRHSGYSGKLDSGDVEYVICGQTQKRMNVSGGGKRGNTWAYPTAWKLDFSKRSTAQEGEHATFIHF